MYKLFIYILLTNGFSILSTQTIEEVGAKIITHKKSFFKDHKMGRLKLESFFLDSRKKLKVRDDYTCVIDYIWSEIKGKHGFKKYTHESLVDELADYSTSRPFMSTQEIINWVKEHNPSNISVHAYTATYTKFMSYISHAPDFVLIFFVKDHHVHPITDPELKKVASSKNQIGTVNLFEHMSELKWTRRHDKFTMYDDLTPKNQNNIIVCPEDLDVRTAICQYMQTSGYYVEYMHFNNNGKLDGFLDHKNMFVENNEYETRKQICKQIQQTRNIHDFQWANQSWTSLTNSLFKIMVGYIPESSYNNKTREILDRYYPIALQWCSFDDKPEGSVNIDICKQFPSILIKNLSTVPIYTTHDNIEKFEGKQEMDNDIGLYYPELNQNGEFYIDTFTIKKFGNQIKFPNGFYHTSLIDFFVYECGMPISNIKYKLIARHGIKKDTFKDFMNYIFKTFPEQIAKKMATSFIGDLGRKYNRTNYGFTCQDLETAQNVWTQGLIDGKNITIDNFEDVYLIREQKIIRSY